MNNEMELIYKDILFTTLQTFKYLNTHPLWVTLKYVCSMLKAAISLALRRLPQILRALWLSFLSLSLALPSWDGFHLGMR